MHYTEKKGLQYHQVSYDGVLVGPGSHQADFFLEFRDDESESVASRIEAVIADWLFNVNTTARQLILSSAMGLDVGIGTYLGVKKPVVVGSGKPGDIDVLIVDEARADEAIAIECKRVKVVAESETADKINKLDNVAGGVTQANFLYEMGFAQTYLAIMSVTDGRKRVNENNLFRGMTTETHRKVYRFPDRDKLKPQIGTIFIEIVQPTGKNIDDSGSVRVCVDEPATPQVQPRDLTERIKEYLANLRRTG